MRDEYDFGDARRNPYAQRPSASRLPDIESVTVTEDLLTAELSDGRRISVPLAWYPRLLHGTPEERADWRLIGKGHGVHWPDLEEDISVENIIFGQPSGESQRSLDRWAKWRTRT